MKMPEAWTLEEVQLALADRKSSRFAPMVLHGALCSLNGGALPEHLLVRARLGTGVTEWRAVWLSGPTIGYAAYTANVEGWGSYYEADHGAVEPTESEAWVRPVRDLTEIVLTRGETKRVPARFGEREYAWTWEATVRINFRHGEPINLPLFGEADDDHDDEQLQAFIDALRTSMGPG